MSITRVRLYLHAELEPLAQDNNYDFNYQEMRKLPQERTVKKGDRFIVECLYKTPNRSVTTFGGLTTKDEMCLSFAMYYPRMPLTTCLSQYNYHSPAGQGSIHHYISTIDWTDENAHKEFDRITNTTSVNVRCQGSHRFASHHKSYSQASLMPQQPYQKPSACPKHAN